MWSCVYFIKKPIIIIAFWFKTCCIQGVRIFKYNPWRADWPCRTNARAGARDGNFNNFRDIHNPTTSCNTLFSAYLCICPPFYIIDHQVNWMPGIQGVISGEKFILCQSSAFPEIGLNANIEHYITDLFPHYLRHFPPSNCSFPYQYVYSTISEHSPLVGILHPYAPYNQRRQVSIIFIK